MLENPGRCTAALVDSDPDVHVHSTSTLDDNFRIDDVFLRLVIRISYILIKGLNDVLTQNERAYEEWRLLQ